MTILANRAWVPADSSARISNILSSMSHEPDAIELRLNALVEENRRIHERDCINLNPATNTMNPRAEALLGAGLGSRPSLGYPGAKYEMGLEAIEEIEVITAALAADVFGAEYAEVRVPSGAIANLYVFMATAKPGDTIIAPPPEIGGHVTHHMAGAAGLYGLNVHAAPVDVEGYTVDLDRLRADALRLRPKLITIGGSLNLFPHPLREMRGIADEVGAKLLFDAAHMSGMIAGKAWQQPLAEGAHAITMSCYKSLAGPPSGLIVSSDAELAERLEAIAYPGLTANFDVAKVAALALTLLDWQAHGVAYATEMAASAQALAAALIERGLAVHAADRGATQSQAFALQAASLGGGHAAALRLRRANILSSGIGLPIAAVSNDMNGLRLGTPEMVRWGMRAGDMAELGGLVASALDPANHPETIAPAAAEFRARFNRLAFIR